MKKLKRLFLWMSSLSSFSFIFVSASCGVEVKNNTEIGKNKDKVEYGNEYFVINVIDGDTIIIDKDDKQVRVRLYGIDTPETYKVYSDGSDNKDSLARLENYYAIKARDELKDMIWSNQRIIKLKDLGLDKYERTLGVIYSRNNEDLNLKLVESGLARVHYISSNPKSVYYTKTDFEKEYHKKLLLIESESKNKEEGFWKAKNIKDVFKKG